MNELSGTELLVLAYLGAGILFILSLSGLSSQESAQRGNRYGIIGMVIALAATMLHKEIVDYTIPMYTLMAGTIAVGSIIGAVLAARVKMTEMPELVAILHSFVGLSAVLVGFSSYLSPIEELTGVDHAVHSAEIYIAIAIGALTFTGSVVAWVKLRGKIFGRWVSGKALILPGRHLLNLFMVTSIIVIAIPVVSAVSADMMIWDFPAIQWLILTAVIAGILGVHLVLSIGGADMPVVVSLLNSYSGWTASAAGFMLSNNLLIITGALVGSSGAILSYIMCKAMNRSIWNVVFGNLSAAAAKSTVTVEGEMVEIVIDDLVQEIKDAQEVVIVPGYGMAAAQAQRSVDTFTKILRKSGKNVRFAIHPVAGRLPGHMNVLLAEAGVPYDIVLEMDEINEDFPKTDVVLVIGANDIVNPSALSDPNSPIAGMPVLEVWNAERTIVFKRGRGKGYAGVVNPLYYGDKTRMFFGDALASIDKINSKLS